MCGLHPVNGGLSPASRHLQLMVPYGILHATMGALICLGMMLVVFNGAQLVCGQVHHRLCGFVIAIRGLVLVSWVCLTIGIAGIAF